MLAVLIGAALAFSVSPFVDNAAGAREQVPHTPAQSSSESDSPSQIRDETERILEGKEFSYEKGYFERFIEWLGKRLGRDREINLPNGGGGAFGGGIGTVVAWLILAVAAAALIFVVVRYFRRRSPKVEDEPDEPLTAVEHRGSAREWDSDAERFEAAGEWKQAMRARYRQLVRELIDRGQLPDIAGRTTRELRVEIEKNAPGAAEKFDAASTLFELPWYGAEETGRAENEQFRTLASEVLEARR